MRAGWSLPGYFVVVLSADDMGLGKTLTVIAHVLQKREEDKENKISHPSMCRPSIY